MFCYVVVTILVSLIIAFLLKNDPEPIIGIYTQKGKYFTIKYWLFYVLFKLRQRQSKRAARSNDAGYGMKSRNSVEDMDRVQDLPAAHPKAVDAVYFNGANKEGYYFVGATARRHNNLVQTLLYIRIPGVGLLEMLSLPDTCLKADKEKSYAAGGLLIEPVEPMKTWRLTFSGPMRLVKPDEASEEVQVSFKLDWTAITRHYDFDTDLDPSALCAAIANEPWSRQFFDSLKVAHQTHYEQFGELQGTIDIANYGSKELAVRGVRDHSYGNLRDWKDIHRYAIQYLYLDNGTAICIGNICFPQTMSRLVIGYVFHADGRMEKVSWTDMQLHAHGEDGNDPTDFKIKFDAGFSHYELEGHVVDRPIFYMGHMWESRIHERLCTYTVNEVPGWGVSEWCYRNHTGRLQEYKDRDT